VKTKQTYNKTNKKIELITLADLGEMLGIGRSATTALVAAGEIAHAAIIGGIMYFCPESVIAWAKTRPNLAAGKTRRIGHYKTRFATEAPDTARDLKAFGAQFTERSPRRYYLTPVENKKLGFVWYVKYLDEGKLVPSKWSTGTGNRDAAEAFAIRNREALLAAYYARKAKKPADMYNLVSGYYDKDSPLLKADEKRGREITDLKRRQYRNTVNKKFIPFVRKNGAKSIRDVDTAMLTRWQNDMLTTLSAKTVNTNVSAVRLIFSHLVSTGYAESNPFASLPPIKPRDRKVTGLYELPLLKGAFGGEWKDEAHRLLNMLIYTTNMRNSEINRIRLDDAERIGGECFLNVRGTKSGNAPRRVPLHPLVHERMIGYASGRDLVFPQRGKTFVRLCSEANKALGARLGYTPEMLRAENIRFYSGRKFWKTLMASEELGRNTEEYFMGHGASGDMEKLYKDLTKVGAEKLAKVAREVFAVLDRCLFG